MAYIIYLRVSTKDQVESGAGLAAQEATCRAYLQKIGENQELSPIFIEAGLSGSKELDHRPALVSAIASLEAGDNLLVAKRDRLGRDLINVAMIERIIERKGARVISAAGESTEADDPSSILMRHIIDAFAEYERLIIGTRTRAALQARKKENRRTGSIPYGHSVVPKDKEKHLCQNPDEQEIILLAKELRDKGHTLRSVSQELKNSGFRSRKGKTFHPQQIARMVVA